MNKTLVICTIVAFFYSLTAKGQIPKHTYPQTKEVTLNFKDSTIIAEVLLFDKKLDIKNDLHYFWYSNNGIHSNLGGTSGDLLHGGYTSLNINNSMVQKGNFTYGLKDGAWKKWYSDGALKSIKHWNNGKLDGDVIQYNTSGEITQRSKYKNGKLVDKAHGKESIKIRRTAVLSKRKEPKVKRDKKVKMKETTFKKDASDSVNAKKIRLPKLTLPDTAHNEKAKQSKDRKKPKDQKNAMNSNTNQIHDTSANKKKDERKKKKGTVINAGKLSNNKVNERNKDE